MKNPKKNIIVISSNILILAFYNNLHLWTFKTPILNVLKLLFLLIIVINNYGEGVYYTLSQTPCSSKTHFLFL